MVYYRMSIFVCKCPPVPNLFLIIPHSAAQTSGELQDYLSGRDRSQLHLSVTPPSRDSVECGEG